MHERAIAEEMLDQAVTQAKSSGIQRITEIRVSVGADSHVTPEALSTWFEVIRGGTAAEPAELQVDVVEGDAVIMLSLSGEG